MTTLADYEAATQQLIQLVWTSLIPTATLDSYINIARMQLAGDAECLRTWGTLETISGVKGYDFSAIDVSSEAGFASALTVRSIIYGSTPIDFRPFEWFRQYYWDTGTSGPPQRAAQNGQGSYGTLVFDPLPDNVYTLTIDVACLPIPLVDDTTYEAIPYPWTDAVPFYAAGYAMMQLQRQADAQAMFARYRELAMRGRQESTPTQLPDNQPGGVGAHAATLKTTLTATQQQRGG